MDNHIEHITTARPISQLERIGYGSCGTVWADAFEDVDIDAQHSAIALKRGDGLPDRSISNKNHIHQQILSAIQM
ncbi:hypothetical protein B0T26DRAFT_856843, partial [Lasiosphaeria miniovina]